jgi:hypothetical protein
MTAKISASAKTAAAWREMAAENGVKYEISKLIGSRNRRKHHNA